MHTTSFWLHFPLLFLERLADLSPSARLNGLAALGNAMRTAAALLLMCDARDLGVSLTDKSGTQTPGFEPDLHLYDNYPGGIGQSQPLYQMSKQLLSASRDLITSCPCESGCPSCVGPEGETGSRGKEIALRIVDALLPIA